jgi:hypothetical protein
MDRLSPWDNFNLVLDSESLSLLEQAGWVITKVPDLQVGNWKRQFPASRRMQLRHNKVAVVKKMFRSSRGRHTFSMTGAGSSARKLSKHLDGHV